MTIKLNETAASCSSNLYKQDFYLWIQTTAQLLRDRQLDSVDFDNLIEEIESMGASERREVKNRLVVLLMHLLKYQYQPEKRSSSWLETIFEQRRQLEYLLKDSPSLKPYYLEVFSACYSDAIIQAAAETNLSVDTFPVESPVSPESAIDLSYIASLVKRED